MTSSKRILIVEDDPDWQEEIAEVLSGYELIAASSVGEACQRINEVNQEKCAIDLVILDLGLSQTTGIDSGLTVLAHLKDQIPNVRCIIFTGRTLPMGKAASLFQEYNIFEGLEKPGDMPRLAKVVRSALAQAERCQRPEPSGEPAPLRFEARGSERLEKAGGSVIKILFLAANPSDTTRLRLDEESRAIDQALRQAEFRDKFEIKQHWAVRVGDIQWLLLRHKPDIVHFSGHGSESSEIILEDNSGNSFPVSVRVMSQLFSVLKDNIKCVVLNACYSEEQAQAIAEHIDCVIGMSNAIGDADAISFATAFYQALGFGRDVKTAFELGCVQIDLASLDEQDTPKLLTKATDAREVMLVHNGE
jgi:CheY-like chemotaxis protein